ncbi:glycosyltransferase family 4 protein [Teichococcus aestuarii]|uniref:Glycosyl transferase n=1 Tax=Teichococcus aestuarii TaxID=568898 RepID=A0A2U1UY36_9PROT|nr:glycosyltransferase family 4 protein [Pseudoroseomonas aestuarii]PWC26565.1 glycosyl transferase [Pseudoroseomonas aestuarii]
MKVVHLVRQFSPGIGGLEDAVINLVLRQRDRLGYNSRVVTLNGIFTQPGARLPPTEHINGIPVRRISWSGSSRYPLAPAVLAQLSGADLVHVHAVDFFFDWLALTRPWHGKPLVATTHGGFFHSGFAAGLKKVWFRTVTRASCRAYDAIVAASHADARMFATIAPGNLVTVENGVDIGKFADAAAYQPTRHVVYFGRFAQHKRIDLLVRLLSELRRLDPSWRLTVAGARSDHSGEDIERMAAASGQAGAVSVLVNPSIAELRGLIGQASFFASASEHEGFGLATVEALAAGLIPVLSDIPSFSAFLSEAGCGVMLRPSALSAAAFTMEGLAGSGPNEIQALRRRCIAASARYGWEGAADRYASVYRGVLRAGGRWMGPDHHAASQIAAASAPLSSKEVH